MPTLDRHLDATWRYRYILFAALACVLWLAMRSSGPADWWYLDIGGRLLTGGGAPQLHGHEALAAIGLKLTGGGLHFYALHPTFQIGPLSLLIARLMTLTAGEAATWLAPLIMTAAGLPVLRLIEHTGQRLASRHKPSVAALFGSACFVVAWVDASVRWGHLDDLLVATAAVGAVALIASERQIAAAAVIGLAVAAKPTGAALLPLLLAPELRGLRPWLTTGGIATLSWLPFIMADSHTLLAGRVQVGHFPTDGSGLSILIGRWTLIPHDFRLAQVLLVLAVGAFAALRGRWVAVPLVCFAARAAVDPGSFSYYGVCVIAAALLWERSRDRTLWIPPATLPALLALVLVRYLPWGAVPSTTLGWLSFAVPALLIGIGCGARGLAREATCPVLTAPLTAVPISSAVTEWAGRQP